MKNSKERDVEARQQLARLEQRAQERILSEGQGDSFAASDTDAQKLVQELRVHQLELEMQNDELRRTQEELASSQDWYADFYNFAPVGDAMLSESGKIEEANQAAAVMLGIEREALVGCAFSDFVAPSDLPVFDRYCKQVLQETGRLECELQVVRKDGISFDVSLGSVVVHYAGRTQIRMAMTDITRYKQAQTALNRQVRIQQALLDINAAVQAMIQPSDLEQVMHACLYAVRKIGMDVQTMAIHRIVDEEECVFESVRVGQEGMLASVRRISPGLMTCWQSNRAIITQDIENEDLEEARKLWEKFKGIQIRSILDCPFSRGVLSVHSVQANAFFAIDEEVLRSIGKIFSVGISRMEDLERITASQNALASIVASSEDAIIATDLDGFVTDWNAAAERVFGYRVEEILDRPIALLLPSDRPDEILRLFERVRAGERVVNYETRRVRKDGQMLQVSLTLSPIKDAEGTIARVSTIVRDITQKQHTEAALQESERRFKDLVDLLPQMVFEIDKDGHFTFVNRKAFELFNYTQADLDQGLTVQELFSSEDHERLRNIIRQRLRGEVSKGSQFTALKKDGSTFPVLIYSTPVMQNLQIVGIRGIAIDITDQKQAEQQMLHYQEQLRSMAVQLTLVEQQDRREIATNLHDRSGQTLAAALLKLGTIKSLAPSSDFVQAIDEVRSLIDQIYKNTRSLVFELSPPALYEQGLTIALQQLAEEVGREYGLSIQVKDDKLSKPLNEEFRDFLFRAVRELLLNVVKHARTDQAMVALSRVRDGIQIQISDQGEGFDISTVGTGTNKGFGLFSIQERLKVLGGSFKIESAPKQGTRVVMELPLDLDAENGRGGRL